MMMVGRGPVHGRWGTYRREVSFGEVSPAYEGVSKPQCVDGAETEVAFDP